MKKIFIFLLLYGLWIGPIQATYVFPKAQADSCEIMEYKLQFMHVIGRAGLKLADLNIPHPSDGHYLGNLNYFRIEVKKLFALTAHVFSEDRLTELSNRNRKISFYLYFDTVGSNAENYFFLTGFERFEPEEICCLDTVIKQNIAGWYAKHGYEERVLKKVPYLLLVYDFSFSDLLRFRKDGKTFPESINNIPDFLQKRPVTRTSC